MKRVEHRRRYILVFHSYIGYGSYVVSFKRTTATKAELKRKIRGDLHFILEGWPKITYPDGSEVGYKE